MNDNRRPRSGLDRWLAEHGEGLVAFRRHVHAHPELSGEEYATTDFIAERLEVAGLEPRILSSGTGLICDIGNGQGPTIALRADIDALAMDDEKDVHYRSQVPGVAHACGHDIHTAIVVGAGLHLAHLQPMLPARIRLIFQPAEERVPGGALDVLADGGLADVDAIFGVHCDPKLDVGKIGLRAGAITSAADMAEITLTGPGGHTARPEQTVDLLTVAAQLITELPARVQDLVGEVGPVKVVFGAIRAGDAANVVPSHALLRASIRTPSTEAWGLIPGAVERATADVVADTGAQCAVDYTSGVPPVVNDASLIETVRTAAASTLADGAVTDAIHSWGGDDFAWYLREIPGTYIRLGTHDPATNGPQLDLHAGHFDADERAIPVGVRVLVATVDEYLRSR